MHGLFLTWLLLASSVSAIWPQPTKIKTGSTVLRLSPAFTISTSKLGHTRLPDLKAAIGESLTRIHRDEMMLLQPDRGLNYTKLAKRASALRRLYLIPSTECKGSFTDISAQAILPLDRREEAYSIIIGHKGIASLAACNALGFFRGLQTFEQLVYTLPCEHDTSKPSRTRFIPNAPISIDDKPAFPYRGQLLDTSRNFLPVKTILKNLQIMSYAKFSQFHWHITDSQSFPLFLPSLPHVARNGAYDPASVYTPQDVSRVIKFANSKGIDVVLEFDNPGHTGSLAYTYPELVDCWQADWLTYAAEPPAGQLDITNPKSIDLVNKIYKDILPRLNSHYFSPGGDELNTACFNKSHPNADFSNALNNFLAKTHSVIRDHQKQSLVWEDLVLSHNTKSILPPANTILVVWSSSEKILDAVKEGYRIVHAASDYLYLDCGLGGWVSTNPNGQSWCAFNSWQHIYAMDPTANMTRSEAKLVEGGTSALWAEQVDSRNIEPVLWPRAAATAEVFWSSKTAANRNLATANARMHDFRYRLVQRGVDAAPIQPHWCALRPGACSL